jgi:hypothetical protein
LPLVSAEYLLSGQNLMYIPNLLFALIKDDVPPFQELFDSGDKVLLLVALSIVIQPI